MTKMSLRADLFLRSQDEDTSSKSTYVRVDEFDHATRALLLDNSISGPSEGPNKGTLNVYTCLLSDMIFGQMFITF